VIDRDMSNSVPPQEHDSSAHSRLRVRHAAEDFELQIRALARRFTVREFVELRAKVEDIFDSILLAGRV
jgi:hypothetical protein